MSKPIETKVDLSDRKRVGPESESREDQFDERDRRVAEGTSAPMEPPEPSVRTR